MKKRRTYSRRRKALLWAVLLCAMVLALVGSGIYKLLPSQTLDYVEERDVLEELEIIHTEQGRYEPVTDRLLMVSRNEDYIVLSMPYFHPLRGWGTSTGAILEPADPEDRHCSWTAERNGGNETWICLFGFVPDGGEAPTFRIGVYNYKAEIQDSENLMIDPVTITPEATIPVEGGKLFLEQYSFSKKEYEELEYCEFLIRVLDDGEWVSPQNWISSGY